MILIYFLYRTQFLLIDIFNQILNKTRDLNCSLKIQMLYNSIRLCILFNIQFFFIKHLLITKLVEVTTKQ